MKRLLLFTLSIALLGSVVSAQNTLSKEERTKALKHLRETQTELLSIVKGLSEAQVQYKPSEESWSIAECLEHIAISENNLFGAVEGAIASGADPSLRSEIKMTDEQIIGLIVSREQKVKTRPEFEPTMQYGGFEGSLDAFKNKRKSNLKFVKTTNADLRNSYFDFPFGKTDAYQVILFMSGHTKRHTDQIKEVMASEGFPTI